MRAIKRAPYRAYFWLINYTDGTLATMLGTTVANISKDGNDFAATISSPVLVADGYGYVDLDATEAAPTENELILQIADDGPNSTDYITQIVFEDCADSGVAQGGSTGTTTAGGTITLAATAPSVDLVGCLVEIVSGQGAGSVRCIVDYNTSTKVATTDRPWLSAGTTPDSSSVYKVWTRDARQAGGGLVDANAVAFKGVALPDRSYHLFERIYGFVDDTTPQDDEFVINSGYLNTNDTYNNGVLMFTSGPNKSIARPVTDYVGSTRTISFADPFPATPTCVAGTVNDASATSISFIGDSGLSATDSEYFGMFLKFTSGALSGEYRLINGYTGSTRRLNFASDFSANPVNGTAFVICDSFVIDSYLVE